MLFHYGKEFTLCGLPGIMTMTRHYVNCPECLQLLGE